MVPMKWEDFKRCELSINNQKLIQTKAMVEVPGLTAIPFALHKHFNVFYTIKTAQTGT